MEKTWDIRKTYIKDKASDEDIDISKCQIKINSKEKTLLFISNKYQSIYLH